MSRRKTLWARKLRQAMRRGRSEEDARAVITPRQDVLTLVKDGIGGMRKFAFVKAMKKALPI
jgi:hypothetical protein